MTPSILTDPALAALIAGMSFERDTPPQEPLKLWEADGLSQFYAPFEYVNRDAKIILLGITPGRTQMNNSLRGAALALRAGRSPLESMRTIKRDASFSGPMRKNIVEILDLLGYPRQLGIRSCASLWGADDHLVHFTSVLRNPVFTQGAAFENYSKTPAILSTQELKAQVINVLAPELAEISPEATIVPLGKPVQQVVQYLVDHRMLRQRVKVVDGRVIAAPHPSGASGEPRTLLEQLMVPARQRVTADQYAQRKLDRFLIKHADRSPPVSQKEQQEYVRKRISYYRSVAKICDAYLA